MQRRNRAYAIAALVGIPALFWWTSRPREDPHTAAVDVSANRVRVATTHTLEDSGLLDSLAARYKTDLPDASLELIVVGSGEALTIGKRGDADALLTHAPEDEREFVASGYGVVRLPVMHNEFLVAGPPSDPAHVRDAKSAADAFTRIRATGARFISRGDDSGTNKKEIALWRASGAKPDGALYIEAGSGMADALRIADQSNAYILTDVATFLALKHNHNAAVPLQLEQLYAGDAVLRNVYSVIVVKAARNATGAQQFADWIQSNAVQELIGSFGKERFGRPLFDVDALTR